MNGTTPFFPVQRKDAATANATSFPRLIRHTNSAATESDDHMTECE